MWSKNKIFCKLESYDSSFVLYLTLKYVYLVQDRIPKAAYISGSSIALLHTSSGSGPVYFQLSWYLVPTQYCLSDCSIGL